MNHRQDSKAQKRAETIAEAVRLRADGMSFRAIAERLSVSHATAQRMVRDALADTVPAAVRDHRAVVLQRIDEVYESQAAQLDNPVAANVALKAAALEARTFIPSLGTDPATRVQPAIQVVNTVTNVGRWLSPEDEQRASAGFVINVDERLIPPPTMVPTDSERGLPRDRAYRAPVDAALDALDS